MPLFPSLEWCRAVVEAANADPDAAAAGQGWRGDVACVVERPGGPFVFWCNPVGGRIADWKVLHDEDELEERDPAYVIRAPLSTWRGLIEGSLDPVQALIERRIRVKGDAEPVIARARHKGLTARVLAAVEHVFPEEP